MLEHRVAGRDAQAVAAPLRFGPVGIEDPDRESGHVEGQQAVGPQASVAVTDAREQVNDARHVGGQVEHQVVVRQRLVLDQMNHRHGDPLWAKEAFALLAREAVAVPGPAADRIGAAAREHSVWVVTGVTEVDAERPSTLYNTLLYHGPDGTLVSKHRKLVPTNHERLIWGQGDGGGLRAIPTALGRLGGLICWENYMPLARFALYESGVEIYIAPTADDGDAWQSTLIHIARESRAFVVSPCASWRGTTG